MKSFRDKHLSIVLVFSMQAYNPSVSLIPRPPFLVLKGGLGMRLTLVFSLSCEVGCWRMSKYWIFICLKNGEKWCRGATQRKNTVLGKQSKQTFDSHPAHFCTAVLRGSRPYTTNWVILVSWSCEESDYTSSFLYGATHTHTHTSWLLFKAYYSPSAVCRFVSPNSLLASCWGSFPCSGEKMSMGAQKSACFVCPKQLSF